MLHGIITAENLRTKVYYFYSDYNLVTPSSVRGIKARACNEILVTTAEHENIGVTSLEGGRNIIQEMRHRFEKTYVYMCNVM